MPGVDWIPGVSHLKAGLQAVTGDTEGAMRTLENFHKECPGVSQVTSLVQLATGDVEGAIETQKRCLGTVNNVANGIPVVGHIKGVVHHAVGDAEGGNQALNAATRTTVVVASGAAAGLATGGIGAIPAGIAAGATYDVAATEITGKDQGCVAAMRNAVENPSAGAIFDAVAVPVGDGLAGYSGGQAANQIATQIELNGLEAARASKLAQLEAGTDAGGMTSGQAIALGKDINTLTSEINTIQHGTPQYWSDVKSGEAAATFKNSNAVAVPVPGSSTGPNQNDIPKERSNDARGTRNDPVTVSNPGRQHVDNRDFEKRKEEDLGNTLEEYEDAIYYDSYVRDSYNFWIETKISQQKKREVLKTRRSEEPKEELRESKSPYLSDEDIEELLSFKNPNNDPRNVSEEGLDNYLGWHWLYLNFPEPISYSGAIQLNSDVQGLYHSLIRHMSDWREFIDIPQELIDRLEPIMTEIRNLESLTETGPAEDALAQAERIAKRTQEARNKLREALGKLSRSALKDIRKALLKIQLLLYDFIRDNITNANFLGISMNEGFHERLNFKVKTRDGKTKVMVICVSDQLYKPKLRIDKRPIKLACTIFFEPFTKNLEKYVLIETKEEMEKRKRQ